MVCKYLFVAALIGCGLTSAWATIDCAQAEARTGPPDELAAIAYVDAATFGPDRIAAEDKLRRYLDATVLGNYKAKLGYVSPVKLRFIVCGGGLQPLTLRERRDVEGLQDLRVALAVWRSSENGKAIVTHVVTGELARDVPSELADSHIVFFDLSSADDVPGRWNDPSAAGAPALQFLIGLSLGMALLEKRDGPGAKLALCKSRGDMSAALDRRLRPGPNETQLTALFQTLIAEADKLIDAGSKPNVDIARRISAACAS
jgi:hypothetical protein